MTSETILPNEEPHPVTDGLKKVAKQVAETLKSSAESTAKEIRDAADAGTANIKVKAEAVLEEAKHRADDFQKEAEQYIRANPLKAVLLALGAGFIAGTLLRR
jgi:ElaB/YqjD/DUF883 family membrane-anchored ribosome-binding protein